MKRLFGTLAALGAVLSGAAALAQIYEGPPAPGSPLVRHNGLTQGFNVKWSFNRSKVHTGVDLAVPKGNRVFSMKQGVVVKTGGLGGDWGDYAVIMNRDGTINGYLHLNLLVKKNDKVAAGSTIGTVYSDHLHLNQCKQADGCQHGAFPNDTYPKQPTSNVTNYYVKPKY